VDISRNRFLFDCISYLLQHAQHLHTLIAHSCSQNFTYGLRLATPCPSLRVLDLADTAVTDDYLRAVKVHAKGLTSLLLDRCYDVSDELVDALRLKGVYVQT
jgi:hypothetical protein